VDEGAPKDITDCRRFFLEPAVAKQRQYEALRAYFVDSRPSAEVARSFGYTPGSFQVLCHQFRRDPAPSFFVAPRRGPQSQPKKSAARHVIVALRKQNHSVYEISQILKERRGLSLSPTAVREVLKSEGFAALPRRLDEERPEQTRPGVEDVADLRCFSLEPREFLTKCGGLFLFLPDLVKLDLDRLTRAAHLPGSKMIPAPHAFRSVLSLKLWSVERRSHVMAMVADQGLALFAGLNVIPKKSYLSEYSSRIAHDQVLKLLRTQVETMAGQGRSPGESFDLDFHSVPFYGDDEMIERHYVSMRSRQQKSVLCFLAQDSAERAFCYSNADIRKGEEPDEILRFISFWETARGVRPRHLVFDSRLTTYANLVRLDEMEITFITLRRRSRSILTEIDELPPSAWRRITLDVPARKFKNPRVFESSATLAGRSFRQVYIRDLGHEQPTILITNDRKSTPARLITRYAQRMLIENALSDAVRFFHMDALSSSVGLKVDFDMALLVVASGLYRLLAGRMRGYGDAQARTIFRHLVDMPATVSVQADQVIVRFHPRAHLPIIAASGILDSPVSIPWWGGRPLILTR
jgi:transposase